MPDFERVTCTAEMVVTDYDDATTPPRTNILEGLPHRYYRANLLNSVGPTIKAVLGGVVGPADGALGGRLFSWWWAAWPGYPTPFPKSLPAIIPTGGSSSIVTIGPAWPDNDDDALGHWVLACRRAEGGTILFPFDVEVTV